MQHIEDKDTKIEIMLRKTLWEKGYRYRKNYDKLPRKQGIVLTKYKIAIFAMENFFMVRIGKFLRLSLRRVLMENFG